MQRNARDVKQMTRAARYVRRRQQQHVDDMRAALRDPATRRTLLRILAAARCDLAHVDEACPEQTATTWHPDPYIHAAQSGRRGLGLLLLRWMNEADPRALLVLVSDAIALAEQLEREVDAAQTTPATQEGVE